MKKKILITGRPGSGKSTLIRKLAQRLGNRAEGFFTEEIRETGKKRQGFKVADLFGREGVLSHVEFKSKQRVGRYGVDVKAFEAVALPAMERAVAEGKILIVDEIGRMELFSHAFRQKVVEALDGPITMVATIHQKPHPFTDQLLKLPDVEIIDITEKNRDSLPELIFKKIQET